MLGSISGRQDIKINCKISGKPVQKVKIGVICDHLLDCVKSEAAALCTDGAQSSVKRELQ